MAAFRWGLRVGPKPDVQAWLRYWQAKQHFGNWKIDVRVVGQAEIPGLSGNIDWDRNARQATIRVLDEADGGYKGSFDCRTAYGAADIRGEMENTIVHELLHLALAPLNAIGTKVEEKAVSDIADPLQQKVIPGHGEHKEQEASLFEIRWFVETKLARLCRLRRVDPKVREQVVARLVDAFREVHPRTCGVP